MVGGRRSASVFTVSAQMLADPEMDRSQRIVCYVDRKKVCLL